MNSPCFYVIVANNICCKMSGIIAVHLYLLLYFQCRSINLQIKFLKLTLRPKRSVAPGLQVALLAREHQPRDKRLPKNTRERERERATSFIRGEDTMHPF